MNYSEKSSVIYYQNIILARLTMDCGKIAVITWSISEDGTGKRQAEADM